MDDDPVGTTSPLVVRLYEVFSEYAYPGQAFCTFCYTPEEIEYITTVPVKDIDVEHGRKLLWECGDHWASPNIYRHYLPRVLELVGPTSDVDNLYPGHLSETLLSQKFLQWPAVEREAVLAYLTAVTPFITRSLDEEDRQRWSEGLRLLASG